MTDTNGTRLHVGDPLELPRASLNPENEFVMVDIPCLEVDIDAIPVMPDDRVRVRLFILRRELEEIVSLFAQMAARGWEGEHPS